MFSFIQNLAFFVATVVMLFVSLPYSKTARMKYRMLRWADGKKHKFLIAISFLYLIAYCLQWYTGEQDKKGLRIQVDNLQKEIKALNRQLDENKRRATLSGKLESDISNESKIYTVKAGGLTSVNFANKEDYFQPLESFNPANFFIKFQNGKMYAKGGVTSLDGKIVAELMDNQWTVNPGNYFQRNYDESAVEVISEDGIPMLQIELVDSLTIQIGGVFLDSNCSVVINDRQLLKFCGKHNQWPQIRDEAEKIQRIFIYPSDLNLGKREHRE